MSSDDLFSYPPVPPEVDDPAPMPSPEDEPNPTLPPVTRIDRLSVSLGHELDALVLCPQDRLVIHLRPYPGVSPKMLEERANQIYNYITTIKGWPRNQVMVVGGPYQLTVFRGSTLPFSKGD